MGKKKWKNNSRDSEYEKSDKEADKVHEKAQAKEDAGKGDQEQNERLADNGNKNEGEASPQNKKQKTEREKVKEHQVDYHSEDSSRQVQDRDHGNEDSKYSSEEGQSRVRGSDEYSSKKDRSEGHGNEDRKDSSEEGQSRVRGSDEYSSKKDRSEGHGSEDRKDSSEEGQSRVRGSDEYSSKKDRSEGHGSEDRKDSSEEGQSRVLGSDEYSSKKDRSEGHGNEDRKDSSEEAQSRVLGSDEYSSKKDRSEGHGNEDRKDSSEEGQSRVLGSDEYSSKKDRSEGHGNEDSKYSSEEGQSRGHGNKVDDLSQENQSGGHRFEDQQYPSEKGRGGFHGNEDRVFSSAEGLSRGQGYTDKGYLSQEGQSGHISDREHPSEKGRGAVFGSEDSAYSSGKGLNRERGNADKDHVAQEDRGEGHGNGHAYSSEGVPYRHHGSEQDNGSQEGRSGGRSSEGHGYPSTEGRSEGRGNDRARLLEEGLNIRHRNEGQDYQAQESQGGGHGREGHEYSPMKGRSGFHGKEGHAPLSEAEGLNRHHRNQGQDHLYQEGRSGGQRREDCDYSFQEGRDRRYRDEDQYYMPPREYSPYEANKGQDKGQWNGYYGSTQKGQSKGQWNEYDSTQKGQGRGRRKGHRDYPFQEGHDKGQWNKDYGYSSQKGQGKGQRNEYLGPQKGQGRGQRNEDYGHPSQNDRGRNYREEYLYDKQGRGKYQNRQESDAERNGRHNKKALTPQMRAALTCSECDSFYSNENRKPKCLQCGHTICSVCASHLIHRSIIGCPKCTEPTRASSVKDLQDNFELLRVLGRLKDVPEASREKTPPLVSPHGSKCSEQGISPTHFCTKCEQWICKACGDADHWSRRHCEVIPVRKALEQMKSKCEADERQASSNLSAALQEISSYQVILLSCINVMRAAHESFGMEETHARDTLDKGEPKLETLKKAVAGFPKDGDPKEALATMRNVKDQCSDIEAWCSTLINNMKFLDDFRKISKTLLNLTAYVHASSDSGKPPPLARIKTADGPRYARLIAEDGRVHAYSAQSLSPECGARAIPMESVKALIDSSSALLFLDLFWGGRMQGRVYIRLTGDTVRGRLFQSLCLGDLGHTHKNGGFHRIWWRGDEGEHIWGGDYGRMNGARGAILCVSEERLAAAASPRPICRGLVAGRYEKENISTIFRIYTKGAKEGTEEAAFGIVEHGLDVVAGAVGQGNVRDIRIADCGVVIQST